MSGHSNFDLTRKAGDLVVLMENKVADEVRQQGDLLVGTTICITAWDVILIDDLYVYLCFIV